MPFYRINGMEVHIRWSGKQRKNPPAPCVASIPSSMVGKPEVGCRDISAFACDWPMGEGTTCDAPLCRAHAHQVGKNRHYCPKHFAEHQAREPELL